MKLADLPGSEDKEFWGDAEINTNIKLRSFSGSSHDELSRDGHYFERIKGMQVLCKHCDWGFDLESGDEIKDGHLFSRGELVI